MIVLGALHSCSLCSAVSVQDLQTQLKHGLADETVQMSPGHTKQIAAAAIALPNRSVSKVIELRALHSRSLCSAVSVQDLQTQLKHGLTRLTDETVQRLLRQLLQNGD